MANSRYSNRYSNSERKKDYSGYEQRARDIDSRAVRDAVYEGNAANNRLKEQRQREQQSYNNKASRDERASMDRANRESARQNHEDYVNRGYNREEEAFNRGRNPGADRMNNTRLKNERALKKGLSDLDRWGQNQQNKMSKNVPSTRPGESGREWEDHKYIDKVTTKNGKVRYIYDVDTSSGSHNSNSRRINDKDLNRARDELNKARNAFTKPTSNKAVLNESARRANDRNSGGGNKLHDPLSELSRAARDAGRRVDSAVKEASKAVSDGAKYVSNALSDIAKNTPLKDIFK